MAKFNYINTDDWFESEYIRNRVQAIVEDRLADDSRQEECRHLMRFWWHMSMGYTEITYNELERNISPEKMCVLNELFEAIGNGSEYVLTWIEKCENTLPKIDELRSANPS